MKYQDDNAEIALIMKSAFIRDDTVLYSYFYDFLIKTQKKRFMP